MLLQLFLLTLWLTQGQASPIGAEASKSECWYGRDRLYQDGQVVRSFQMYCTAVVCRGVRIVLEPIQNCTCLEISGLELRRTGPKWQTLADDEGKDEELREEQQEKREEEDEYETEEGDEYETEEGDEYDYETEEGEDEDYGSSADSSDVVEPRLPIKDDGRLLMNATAAEQKSYPVGAMALPTGQLPGGLSAKQVKRHTYRCRLNGWRPRLTDGTLQALGQNCVRLTCASASNGNISLQLQARTGCTCA